MPERVPKHAVAPDGRSTPEGEGPAGADQAIHIALIIPLRNWMSFAKYIQGNVRVVKPAGFDNEVVIHVLPDLGEDMVDFSQYDSPTVDLTLLKAALKP